jgi:hypothetical protein
MCNSYVSRGKNGEPDTEKRDYRHHSRTGVRVAGYRKEEAVASSNDDI